MRSASLLFAAALVAPALASGSTPPLPLPEERLADYATCLANLKNIHTLDLKRIDTAPQTRADGSVLQRSLVTEGVIETGPETAIYKAEYGVTVSARDAAAGRMKHQYSWERVEYTCAGGTLTGLTSQGYASPAYEPLPD